LPQPVAAADHAAMAALMMLFGLYAFFSMSKDIFPAVNIPEVNLVWYYPHSEF
jgi:multidrug efflux pump subunit AcrB